MDKQNFISSKETKKKLKISSCDLMHLRLEGNLNFIKKGNAYFYSIEDIRSLLSN